MSDDQQQIDKARREKVRLRDKEYYVANREKILVTRKEYKAANPDKVRACTKAYKAANSEKLRATSRTYYNANREEILASHKIYRDANKEKAKTYARKWKKENPDKVRENKRRELKTIRYRVQQSQRTRFHKFLKNQQTTGRLADWVGCDWDTLIFWLETIFEPGMTWDNYGMWHIDHKKPLASFDLLDEKQAAEAWHFSNLQPLWAKDNLSKGSKLDWTKLKDPIDEDDYEEYEGTGCEGE